MIERTKCNEIIIETRKYFITVYGNSKFSQCQRRSYKVSNPQALKLAQKHAENLSKYYNVPITKIEK